MLFAQSLDALQPPLGVCIQRAVKGGSDPLTTLAELRQVGLFEVEIFTGLYLINGLGTPHQWRVSFITWQAALRFVKRLERALAKVEGELVLVDALSSHLWLCFGEEGDFFLSFSLSLHLFNCLFIHSFFFFPPLPPLPPPPPPPSSSPADTSAVYPLLESVHGPYCQLLVQYPSMETQLLTQSLRSLQSVSDTYIPSPFHTHTSHTPSPPPLTHMHTHIHTQPLPTSIEDSISLISESVLNVFTCTFEALERCVQLTEGWGICGLIKAIEVGRIRLLSYISNVLCPCQE